MAAPAARLEHVEDALERGRAEPTKRAGGELEALAAALEVTLVAQLLLDAELVGLDGFLEAAVFYRHRCLAGEQRENFFVALVECVELGALEGRH